MKQQLKNSASEGAHWAGHSPLQTTYITLRSSRCRNWGKNSQTFFVLSSANLHGHVCQSTFTSPSHSDFSCHTCGNEFPWRLLIGLFWSGFLWGGWGWEMHFLQGKPVGWNVIMSQCINYIGENRDWKNDSGIKVKIIIMAFVTTASCAKIAIFSLPFLICFRFMKAFGQGLATYAWQH